MLDKKKVEEFILFTLKRRDLEFWLTSHLRMSSFYWASNSLKLINSTELKNLKPIALKFINDCKNTDGGYGGNIGYKSNVTSTLSALQILEIFDSNYFCLQTENYLLSQINKDGTPKDELDNRLMCCIILSLLICNRSFSNEKVKYFSIKYLLRLEIKNFPKEEIIKYILDCYNWDGGFGSFKSSESHSAQVFCCLAILKSLNYLEYVDIDKISHFLAFRQQKNGGLTGRPNKKSDVCYAFWTFSALKIIGKESFICKNKLKTFIYKCQSTGFGDKPGKTSDLYHTMFALAGLSLLDSDDLCEIDPILCI